MSTSLMFSYYTKFYEHKIDALLSDLKQAQRQPSVPIHQSPYTRLHHLCTVVGCTALTQEVIALRRDLIDRQLVQYDPLETKYWALYSTTKDIRRLLPFSVDHHPSVAMAYDELDDLSILYQT